MNELATTQLLTTPTIATITGIIMLVIWFANKELGYLKYFAISFLAYTIVSLQISFLWPEHLPALIVSTAIGYCIFVLGFYAGMIGVLRLSPKWELLLVCSTVFIILRYYSGVVLEDRMTRLFVLYGYYSIVLFVLALQIFKNHQRLLHRSIATGLALLAFIAIVHVHFLDNTEYAVFSLETSDYFVNKQFVFNIIFIVLFASTLAVVSQRTVRSARLEGETDMLTKVVNRRGWERQQHQYLTNATHYSLICLDLDHFKSVNDNHGHDTGDNVLRAFAALLQRCVRDNDLVARLGGEEFIILLPETRLTSAVEIARRIKHELQHFRIQLRGTDAEPLSVTASFGVGEFKCNEHTVTQATRIVDMLLYQAKKSGRNTIISQRNVAESMRQPEGETPC